MKKTDEKEEEEAKKQECFHLKFLLLIYVCRLFIYNRSKNAIELHKKREKEIHKTVQINGAFVFARKCNK